MSILTLWFSAGGNPMIVKLDILRNFHLTFKKASFYPEGDINYYTLRLSSEGEAESKAEDEEWEQPERMLHFSCVYKARVTLTRKGCKQARRPK